MVSVVPSCLSLGLPLMQLSGGLIRRSVKELDIGSQLDLGVILGLGYSDWWP